MCIQVPLQGLLPPESVAEGEHKEYTSLLALVRQRQRKSAQTALASFSKAEKECRDNTPLSALARQRESTRRARARQL